MENIYIIENGLTEIEYSKMRFAVGWQEISAKQLKNGIKNCFYNVIAIHNGKTIGMARVINDGGYTSLISDVIVLPEYQGKSVGKAMIENIMKYLKATLDDNESMLVCLLAAKDKEGFYSRFGFDVRPNANWGSGMSQWITK